jgi:HPt (histidine-containing phosphotransfer) domain-containing protein
MEPNARFQERLRGLLQDYVAGLPGRLTALREAVVLNDRVGFQHQAHRLAGTGLSYGAPELTDWGREVERKCKAGVPLTELEPDIDRLSRLIGALVNAR